MRMPAAFLKTRIARRVFGLFLLCAVVPTALIATASYWMVTRELKAQARTQVAQAAKVSGTLVLARLHEAERALDELAGELARDSTFAPESNAKLTDLFHSLSLGSSAHGPRLLYGPGIIVSVPADDASRRQLDAGRAVLVVQPGTPAARIVLIRRMGPESGGGPLLAGEITAEHLWGDEGSEPLVPPDTDFCVYVTGEAKPLYCTNAVALEDEAREAMRQAVIGSSELFLGFEFASPSWSVRLSRPLESFSAPIEFRRLVLLTLLLGIWLVVFASNVLLRHRLDPVSKLQEATRRVADGDFSASVTLATRDELDDLAQSFNVMAGRLRSQFALLTALHEVDRRSLLAQSGEDIAREAVVHFPRLLEIEEAVIAMRAPTADGPHDAVVIKVGPDGVIQRRLMVLPPSSLSELELSGTDYHLIGRSEVPSELIRGLGLAQMRSHLVLPLRDRHACFAAIALTAPSDREIFTVLDARRARQVADQIALAIGNARLVERLNAMSWGTLQALARSIDAASPWTAGHSERVTRVGVAIGRQLDLAPDLIDQLHRGGLLHDVGKIGVPAAILDKPGKLTDAEFDTIRAHPVIGARILEPILAYEDVIPIVRHHHERFNGSGYPDRLAGRAIPYLARVLSVADVYDALVSRRPYRDGWSHEDALNYITSRAGIEFDPGVVTAFVELVVSPAWKRVTDQVDPVPATHVLDEGGQRCET